MSRARANASCVIVGGFPLAAICSPLLSFSAPAPLAGGLDPPPPCGEGSGVGVATSAVVSDDPPPRPSPARGEGGEKQGGGESRCPARGEGTDGASMPGSGLGKGAKAVRGPSPSKLPVCTGFAAPPAHG